MLVTRARDNACFVAFCNLVGGQDELIFDGHSRRIRQSGRAPRARPGVRRGAGPGRHRPRRGRRAPSSRHPAACARSGSDRRPRPAVANVCLATSRTRQRPVAPLGTSSSRCERARARPARLRREERLPRRRHRRLRRDRLRADGRAGGRCARRLSRPWRLDAVPLQLRGEPARPQRWPRPRLRVPRSSRSPRPRAFEETLATSSGPRAGLAEENLQARIRGTLLMALSNTFGWLVVATGNKSELAVGYSTLYGDMAGGFALLKDVFKTDV